MNVNVGIDVADAKEKCRTQQPESGLQGQHRTFNELGVKCMSVGDAEQALALFNQAIAAGPDKAAAFYNAGLANQQLGRLDQAINCYQNALRLQPAFSEAFFNMGVICLKTNAPRKAIPLFIKAIEINPAYAEAFFNLGLSYERTGEKHKALTAYEQTLHVRPDHAKALNNIGLLELDAHNTDAACDYFKRALAVNPHLAQAHHNMGIALQALGEYQKGRLCYLDALRVDRHYAPAKWLYHLSLPNIYRSTAQIKTTRAAFLENLEKLIESTPLETGQQKKAALKGIGTTTNFFLQYQGHNDLEIQGRYGRFVCDVMAANYPHWSESKPMPVISSGQKIRVGYVTAFMYAHTVGDFLLGWVENHNPSHLEIHCYHLGTPIDAITHRIAAKSCHFHHVAADVESIAKKISDDDLHVLVFPEIGMSPMALQLAALKLAPVQCVGWGHPVTTGLPTMDYFLSSDLMEPEAADQYYTEKLIRLPNLSLCYRPPELPPQPKKSAEFGIPEARFVFLSTQSLYKYLPGHDDIYPRIAAQAPDALFVFISDKRGGITEIFKERLYSAFEKQGLDGRHFCRFTPRLNHSDFLSLNLCADVLLDSLEWSGGHTTIEAISCGLPVVTLPGPFMRGRHSYAMLEMMEVTQTIAQDKSDYCRIASRLAQDSIFHTRIKALMKQNRARLYHDLIPLESLENFYHNLFPDTPAKKRVTDSHTGNRQGQPDAEKKGEQYYLGLLKKKPDNAKAAFALGTIYLQSKDIHNALKWLKKALSSKPLRALVHNNIGKTHELAGDDAQARTSFQKALQQNPDLAEACFNLAELDAKTERPEQALAHYTKAVRIAPSMGAAHNNMGNLLRDLKRYPEAIAAFSKVVALNDKLPQGHYNLGSTYRLIEAYPKAIAHLSEAIKLQPDYADAWNNLAITCKNMGDLERAITYLNRALQIDPEMSVARWNRSFVNFLMGNWREGWRDFEARFDVPHWRSIYPHRIDGTRWDGNPIPGKTLLVHDEQGLGDTFQFVRLLPWARQYCGRLILETRAQVKSLLLDQNTLGIDEIVVRSATHPPDMHYDQYIPLMSLPFLARITPQHPNETPAYIKAPEEKIARWQPRLPRGPVRVGLVWAGRPEHGNDANRSCDISAFSPLFRHEEIQFVGLQKGPAASQAKAVQRPNFENLGTSLENFADTAAILAQIDLVITVDTSVAHLAGAMGKPVWVLIPFIPDWRWGIRGMHTPWYPTMRLFRQHRPKNWASVMDQIASHLNRWLAGRP